MPNTHTANWNTTADDLDARAAELERKAEAARAMAQQLRDFAADDGSSVTAPKRRGSAARTRTRSTARRSRSTDGGAKAAKLLGVVQKHPDGISVKDAALRAGYAPGKHQDAYRVVRRMVTDKQIAKRGKPALLYPAKRAAAA